MNAQRLPAPHLLLAVLVVAVWGTNFVVIKEALDELPPLLFAALRFTFAAFPLVFFIPRPKASWRNLAAYGILLGVGQFGIMFIAMRSDITPGLASLIIQVQVFFTIGLSMALAGERLRLSQGFAIALAAAGIALVLFKTDSETTVRGVVMVLVAAMGWASANLVAKRAGALNALSYVSWASIFAVPPLFLLTLMADGPTAIGAGIRDASLNAWLAVAWQSIGNTLFGYGAWSWLMARHPAATVSPLALLVPVFGFAASAFWLDESLPSWKLMASGLVILGLALNFIAPAIASRRTQAAA